VLTCSPAEPQAAPTATIEIRLDGFRARVSGPPSLLTELPTLFQSSLGASPATELGATFQVEQDAPRRGWYRVTGDDRQLWEHHDPATLLPTLEAAIYQAAERHLGQRYLLFHAGAVARNGRGFIFPAPSGSGKSTLVAWLLAHEFQYFSDEVAMLEPASRHLIPFPKSLHIKDGARDALAAVYPQFADGAGARRLDGREIWYLPPPPQAVPHGTVPVRYVILPRWLQGG
jgi:hypothetical protein